MLQIIRDSHLSYSGIGSPKTVTQKNIQCVSSSRKIDMIYHKNETSLGISKKSCMLLGAGKFPSWIQHLNWRIKDDSSQLVPTNFESVQQRTLKKRSPHHEWWGIGFIPINPKINVNSLVCQDENVHFDNPQLKTFCFNVWKNTKMYQLKPPFSYWFLF